MARPVRAFGVCPCAPSTRATEFNLEADAPVGALATAVDSAAVQELSATVARAVVQRLDEQMGGGLMAVRHSHEVLLGTMERLMAQLRRGDQQPVIINNNGTLAVLSETAEEFEADAEEALGGESPSARANREPSSSPQQSGSGSTVKQSSLSHIGSEESELSCAAQRKTAQNPVNIYDLDSLRADIVFLSHGLAEVPSPAPKSRRPSLGEASTVPWPSVGWSRAAQCVGPNGDHDTEGETRRHPSEGLVEAPGTLPENLLVSLPGSEECFTERYSNRSDGSAVDPTLDRIGPMVSQQVSYASNGSSVPSSFAGRVRPWPSSSVSHSSSSQLSSSTNVLAPLPTARQPSVASTERNMMKHRASSKGNRLALGARQMHRPRNMAFVAAGSSSMPASLPSALSGQWCSVIDSLRNEHERELLQAHAGSEISETLFAQLSAGQTGIVQGWLLGLPNLWLRLAGLKTFGKSRLALHWTRVGPQLSALILLCSAVLAGLHTSRLYAHLVNACYALGCLVGLVHLQWSGRIRKLIGPDMQPLETYAHTSGFFGAWQRISTARCALVFAVWLCMVLARVLAFCLPVCNGIDGDGLDSAWDAVELACFVAVTWIFGALVYCQLYIYSGLELAVDNYCIRFVYHLDFEKAVTQWGVVQALLRRAANTVDICVLALGTLTLATVVLTCMRILQLDVVNRVSRNMVGSELYCTALWSGWALPPVLLWLYTIFRAAAISEKCSRVPSFMNSWELEKYPLDASRQYAVQHITQSAGGFYVKGVRLSAIIALKFTYLFGLVLFTGLSRFVLSG